MLDPENVEVIITCSKCSSMLWTMKILKYVGNRPISMQYTPCLPSIPKFSDTRLICPLCGEQYYETNDKGEHVYTVINPATGMQIQV